MKAKHTAGPYTCDKYGNIWGPENPESKHENRLTYIGQIVDAKGRHGLVADRGTLDAEGKATAEQICRACNCHEELLALLDALLSATFDKEMEEGFCLYESETKLRAQVLDAIANAKI